MAPSSHPPHCQRHFEGPGKLLSSSAQPGNSNYSKLYWQQSTKNNHNMQNGFCIVSTPTWESANFWTKLLPDSAAKANWGSRGTQPRKGTFTQKNSSFKTANLWFVWLLLSSVTHMKYCPICILGLKDIFWLAFACSARALPPPLEKTLVHVEQWGHT